MRTTTVIGAWRRRLALTASACAIASLAAAGTATANHSIDVNVTVDSQNFFPGPAPSNAHAFGHVEPGPTACLRGRNFKLYNDTDPGNPVDTSRSSRNGFFALGGNLSAAPSVTIKMTKKTFGPQGNRHTCQSDSKFYSTIP